MCKNKPKINADGRHLPAIIKAKNQMCVDCRSKMCVDCRLEKVARKNFDVTKINCCF